MKKENLIGWLPKEQIATLKASNGGVLFFASDEKHVAYFRKPTIQETAAALSMKDKPVEMTEMLLSACKVGGSDVFIKEVDYMLGAGSVVEKMLAVKQCEVGNL